MPTCDPPPCASFFFFWHGTAETIINMVYVDPPDIGGGVKNPPAHGALLGQDGFVFTVLLQWIPDLPFRTLVYVMLKLCVYLVVAVVCHRHNYFWKI